MANGVTSGCTPLQIGVGADIIPEKGVWPQVALIAGVFTPATGGSDFRQENLGVSLKTGFYHNLKKNRNAS